MDFLAEARAHVIKRLNSDSMEHPLPKDLVATVYGMLHFPVSEVDNLRAKFMLGIDMATGLIDTASKDDLLRLEELLLELTFAARRAYETL